MGTVEKRRLQFMGRWIRCMGRNGNGITDKPMTTQ